MASNVSYEFLDLLAAIAEAKRVLGEMVLNGLPGQPDEALAVEVLNFHGLPLVGVRLTIRVDFLAA